MLDDFERPPPPPPPPLDLWLSQSDRADNRREPFFVGREDEYAVFARGARLLRDGNVGGEAIIFQGAPGAGKSALMQECIEAARTRSTATKPWVAQSLDVHTLADPAALCRLLLRGLRREQLRLADVGPHRRMERLRARLQEAWDELSARGGGAGGVRIGARPPGGIVAEDAFDAIVDAFEDVRVVLFIDEAQNVGKDARAALSVLSRGQAGIDLLPVFFGLGDAAAALDERGGLSRPPDEGVVEMGALSDTEVRESLEMAFDAYSVSGSARDGWLDELTALSQGWPQHLNRAAKAAGRELEPHGMDVDAATLGRAVAAGQQANERYYTRRLRDFSAMEQVPLKALGARLTSGTASLHEDELRAAVTDAGVTGEKAWSEWFEKALRRGVLAPDPRDSMCYRVPIPSLATHMANLDVPPSARPSSASPSP